MPDRVAVRCVARYVAAPRAGSTAGRATGSAHGTRTLSARGTVWQRGPDGVAGPGSPRAGEAGQMRKMAAPQVKPAPNTDDRTSWPFLTLPSLRQWSIVSGTVAAVVLP